LCCGVSFLFGLVATTKIEEGKRREDRGKQRGETKRRGKRRGKRRETEARKREGEGGGEGERKRNDFSTPVGLDPKTGTEREIGRETEAIKSERDYRCSLGHGLEPNKERKEGGERGRGRQREGGEAKKREGVGYPHLARDSRGFRGKQKQKRKGGLQEEKGGQEGRSTI